MIDGWETKIWSKQINCKIPFFLLYENIGVCRTWTPYISSVVCTCSYINYQLENENKLIANNFRFAFIYHLSKEAPLRRTDTMPSGQCPHTISCPILTQVLNQRRRTKLRSVLTPYIFFSDSNPVKITPSPPFCQCIIRVPKQLITSFLFSDIACFFKLIWLPIPCLPFYISLNLLSSWMKSWSKCCSDFDFSVQTGIIMFIFGLWNLFHLTMTIYPPESLF